MTRSAIALSRIDKKYGVTPVLRSVELDIEEGEFLTLVGPSGCGKSTLLRVIAGLEMQDSGNVFIAGRPVDHLRPKQRDIAMVFQSYALYPHMTVEDNMTMPLLMRRMSFVRRFPGVGRWMPGSRRIREDIATEIRAVADQLQIGGLLSRMPAQLSGGQRQRVALGRAMVRRPYAFLMDEPLSNLDARLRVEMRAELADLHRRLEATFIYVTHDQVEAMTMSRRIAVMMDGEIVQLGTPEEVYNDPQDLRVARFIGSPPINVLPGKVTSAGTLSVFTADFGYRVSADGPCRVQVGVRPEDVEITEFRIGLIETGGLQGRLRHLENLGNEYVAYVDVDFEGDQWTVVSRFPPRELHRIGSPGAPVGVFLNEDKLFVFSEAGGRLSASAPAKSSIGRAS